jgi:hypothetical protein
MAAQKVSQSTTRRNHGSAELAEKRVAGEDPLPNNPAPTNPQFELENHGSLFLLRPLTSAATEWMQENLPMDSPETQFWGEAIVIEPRYLEPIIEGILADGLVLR